MEGKVYGFRFEKFHQISFIRMKILGIKIFVIGYKIVYCP